MPVWPFNKPEPREEEPPKEDIGGLRRDVKAIKDMLSELLSRPSSPPADVVAAHLQVAQERRKLLETGKLPLAPEDPMFVPSTILPDDAEAVIKTEESEVEKDDFSLVGTELNRHSGSIIQLEVDDFCIFFQCLKANFLHPVLYHLRKTDEGYQQKEAHKKYLSITHNSSPFHY